MRPIVDPRLPGMLAGFYPSLCTFQQWTEVVDPVTYEVSNTWAAVPGHTDLPCACAAASGQETRRADSTVAVNVFRIALPSDETGMDVKMRVVVTGPNAGTYNVLLIEGDSHGVTTRVTAEKVSL